MMKKSTFALFLISIMLMALVISGCEKEELHPLDGGDYSNTVPADNDSPDDESENTDADKTTTEQSDTSADAVDPEAVSLDAGTSAADSSLGSSSAGSDGNYSYQTASEILNRAAAEMGMESSQLEDVCSLICVYISDDYMAPTGVDYVKLDSPVLLNAVDEVVSYYVNSARYVDEDLDCEPGTQAMARAILDALVAYSGGDNSVISNIAIEHADQFHSMLRNTELYLEQ